MSQVLLEGSDRNQVYIHDVPNKDNNISRFPKIILEDLSSSDKEKIMSSWTEKCKSERIQAAKSCLYGIAGLMATGALLYLVLHFFILNSVTSYFAFRGWHKGELLYRVASHLPLSQVITPLSIAGFGGGLGMIGGGAYAIFDKLIKPHFDEAATHLKKARHIEKELFKARHPEIAPALPVQSKTQAVAAKVLSESELKQKQMRDFAKAVLYGALTVFACAGTAVAFYFLAKGLLLFLIDVYFTPIGGFPMGSYFILDRSTAISVLSVLFTAEITTIGAIGLYRLKLVVNHLFEKAKENWHQATVSYSDNLASLRIQDAEKLKAFKERVSAERRGEVIPAPSVETEIEPESPNETSQSELEPRVQSGSGGFLIGSIG